MIVVDIVSERDVKPMFTNCCQKVAVFTDGLCHAHFFGVVGFCTRRIGVFSAARCAPCEGLFVPKGLYTQDVSGLSLATVLASVSANVEPGDWYSKVIILYGVFEWTVLLVTFRQKSNTNDEMSCSPVF